MTKEIVFYLLGAMFVVANPMAAWREASGNAAEDGLRQLPMPSGQRDAVELALEWETIAELAVTGVLEGSRRGPGVVQFAVIRQVGLTKLPARFHVVVSQQILGGGWNAMSGERLAMGNLAVNAVNMVAANPPVWGNNVIAGAGMPVQQALPREGWLELMQVGQRVVVGVCRGRWGQPWQVGPRVVEVASPALWPTLEEIYAVRREWAKLSDAGRRAWVMAALAKAPVDLSNLGLWRQHLAVGFLQEPFSQAGQWPDEIVSALAEWQTPAQVVYESGRPVGRGPQGLTRVQQMLSGAYQTLASEDLIDRLGRVNEAVKPAVREALEAKAQAGDDAAIAYWREVLLTRKYANNAAGWEVAQACRALRVVGQREPAVRDTMIRHMRALTAQDITWGNHTGILEGVLGTGPAGLEGAIAALESQIAAAASDMANRTVFGPPGISYLAALELDAKSLREADREAMAQRLKTLLETQSEELRAFAAAGLGALNHQESAEILMRLWEDQRQPSVVRVAACEGLLRMPVGASAAGNEDLAVSLLSAAEQRMPVIRRPVGGMMARAANAGVVMVGIGGRGAMSSWGMAAEALARRGDHASGEALTAWARREGAKLEGPTRVVRDLAVAMTLPPERPEFAVVALSQRREGWASVCLAVLAGADRGRHRLSSLALQGLVVQGTQAAVEHLAELARTLPTNSATGEQAAALLRGWRPGPVEGDRRTELTQCMASYAESLQPQQRSAALLERIAAAMARLSAPDYQQREAATADLIAVGLAARRELQLAAAENQPTANPEQAARARRILGVLETPAAMLEVASAALALGEARWASAQVSLLESDIAAVRALAIDGLQLWSGQPLDYDPLAEQASRAGGVKRWRDWLATRGEP